MWVIKSFLRTLELRKNHRCCGVTIWSLPTQLSTWHAAAFWLYTSRQRDAVRRTKSVSWLMPMTSTSPGDETNGGCGRVGRRSARSTLIWCGAAYTLGGNTMPFFELALLLHLTGHLGSVPICAGRTRKGNGACCAVKLPSTNSATPVMPAAASLHSKNATSPMHSGGSRGRPGWAQLVANARFSLASEQCYPIEYWFSNTDLGQLTWPVQGFPTYRSKRSLTCQSRKANAGFQAWPRAHTGGRKLLLTRTRATPGEGAPRRSGVVWLGACAAERHRLQRVEKSPTSSPFFRLWLQPQPADTCRLGLVRTEKWLRGRPLLLPVRASDCARCAADVRASTIQRAQRLGARWRQ